MRKLIDFDDETLDKLIQLGRDRMATTQELADEAFADLLKKHGVPIDLKDALRKSVKAPGPSSASSRNTAMRPAPRPARKKAHAKRSAKRSI
jgi:non-homologous end joining protein Ku